MDWMEFVASLVDSILSWPVAILLIVFILRKPLSKVLADLTSGMREFTVEALGQKLTVSRQIEELKDKAGLADVNMTPAPATAPTEATTEPAGDTPAETVTPSPLEFLEKVVSRFIERSPNEAIMEMWGALQAELGSLALAAGLDINSWGRPSVVHVVIGHLVEGGVLSPEAGEQLRGLMQVRNGISHGSGQATPKAAADFYVLAVRMWVTVRAAYQRSRGVGRTVAERATR